MADFDSILHEAQQLSEADRIRLMEALWQTVPDDADFPLHPAWADELQRRVNVIESGSAATVPWSTVLHVNSGSSRLPQIDLKNSDA